MVVTGCDGVCGLGGGVGGGGGGGGGSDLCRRRVRQYGIKSRCR